MLNNTIVNTTWLWVVWLTLISCSSYQNGNYQDSGSRYSITHDHGPSTHLNPDTIADAVPRADPILALGNKSPYTVNGKQYHLLTTAKDYKVRGTASWYGKKFHGHSTANGEIYDMYAMTAAHKTLPIPSYAKITNITNGKSTIVRINDRGPFHSDRIIDVSYAAATKLGFTHKGIASVEIKAIDAQILNNANPQTSAKEITAETQPNTTKTWLSVAIFDNYAAANQLMHSLHKMVEQSVLVDRVGNDYRVKIGPVANNQANRIAAMLVFAELGEGEVELIHE